MPVFRYRGYEVSGRSRRGRIEAASSTAASKALEGQGIFPLQLTEVGAARPSSSRRRRLAATDLAVTCRQLAVLVSAGISAEEALGAVSRRPGRSQAAQRLAQVRERLLAGSSFSAALEVDFPPLLVSLVRVAESSGDLGGALEAAAQHYERAAKLRSRLISACAYPALMLLVGGGVLLFLLAFVVPKVTQMFADLGQSLPLATRILLATSSAVASWWWLAALLLSLGALAAERALRDPSRAQRLDAALLRLPLLGVLWTQAVSARICGALATLLSAGVPLVPALRLCSALCGNRAASAALVRVAQAVEQGEGATSALRREELLPESALHLVAAGEGTGQLGPMFERAARATEADLDATLSTGLALVEPLLILALASVVGFVVVAVLLPIFEASTALG